MAGRKTTTVQYETQMERLFEVLLYEKLSNNEMRRKFALEFEISTRQVTNMLSEARKRLKERFMDAQGEIVEEQIQRYTDLIKRAREAKSMRIEREALADLSKLYGIEKAPSQKIDVETSNDQISISINLSPTEK